MAAAIPKTASDVTADWLKTSLKSSLNETVSVLDIKVVDNRDGLLSTTLRATVTTGGDAGQAQRHHLFLKILPPNESHRQLIHEMFLDVTELETYRTLLSEFATLERDISGTDSLRTIHPRFYGGGCDKTPNNRRHYLILEDGVPGGFKMLDFNAGLTCGQVKSCLRKIAIFHALSLACKHKTLVGADYSTKYGGFLSRFLDTYATGGEIMEFLEDDIDNIAKDLAASEKLGVLRKGIMKRLLKAYASDPGAKEFLVHGDFWANNILFNEANDDCKVIDWQFVSCNSVLADISLVAYLSMDPKESEANLEAFFDAYYSALEKAAASFGVSSHLPWDRAAFMSMVDKLSALVAFCSWCATSYELSKTFPALIERTLWTLDKCLKKAPDLCS